MREFNLLPDRPIKADDKKDIKFGHDEIAQTVFSLVDKAEAPFTIGLYGRWGVGKTTIAKSVEKEAREAGIPVFFFDVWKYEQDSLRRQFLIELDKNLCLGLDYKNILNQSLSIEDPTKAPLIFDARLVFNKIGVAFLVLLFVALAAKIFGLIKGWGDSINLVSDSIIALGLAGLLFQAAINAITRVHQTIIKYRTDSAEGFEDRFQEALKKIEQKKLLIIIDNLDRIEDKKMVEILSDVKTFLSKDGDETNDKVVFLIPCDNNALRAQLVSTYGSYFDADEFLRKFFNLTFEIPKFTNLDLNDYVQALLKAAGVKNFTEDPDVESVIIYAFRDNPREIKQFVNSLVATYSLACKRSLDTVIKNPAFLAKILVIRQKFSDIYQIIQEKALREFLTLDEVDLLSKIHKGLSDPDDSLQQKNTNKFTEFNRATESINQKDLAVFISLRQSPMERRIPDSEKLIIALEENRIAEAKEIAEKILADSHDNGVGLDEILRDRIVRSDKGINFSNLASSGISIFNELNKDMPKFVNAIATHSINLPANFVQTVQSDIFIDFFYQLVYPSQQKNILKLFMRVLDTSGANHQPAFPEDFMITFIKTFLKHEDKFQNNTNRVSNSIESFLFHYPYISLFDSKELQEKYITDNAKDNFIASIDGNKSPRPAGEITSIFKYLTSLELKPLSLVKALQKLPIFLETAPRLSFEYRKEIIEGVRAFIANNDTTVEPRAEIKGAIEKISTLLIPIFDAEVDEPGTEKFIKQNTYYPLMKLLIQIDFNGMKASLIKKIQGLIESMPIGYFDSQQEDILAEMVQLAPQGFVSKAITYPESLLKKGIYKLFPENNLNMIILRLVDNIKPEFPAVIKSLGYQFQNKTDLITRIYQKLQQIPLVNLSDWLDALKELGVGENTSPNDQFFVMLKAIKRQDAGKAKKIKEFVENNIGLFNAKQQEDLGVEQVKKIETGQEV